jgi:hypothetical protein
VVTPNGNAKSQQDRGGTVKKPFVRLADPAPFPGTVTRVHTGLRHLKIGDIISIEWQHKQLSTGHDVAGKIKNLALEEKVGAFGPSLVGYITLEEGWYSMGMNHVFTPTPGSAKDGGESVLSFVPTVHKAEWEHTWELATTDQPGWHLFILGGSDERLAEIADLMGKSVEELTTGVV